jgi:prepilin-type N-terminal cleavage/methylation domain-containing protein
VNKKAFTLIELLLVISIISLLSSVILSSLNVARNKGFDTAVKAGMKQLHIQNQQYLDTPGVSSFGTSVNCVTASTVFTNATTTAILNNITSNANTTPVLSCASTGTFWAVSVTLKSGSSFCTDNSQGWFKTGGTVNTGTAQCN